MCGLAGYVARNADQIYTNEAPLHSMARTLAHRGPEGHGIWVDPQKRCALVHTRLKIIDLSQAGYQPMFDQEQQIVIVYNGELYNHAQLRVQLEQLGYSYRSQTDTETIIYAYKEWGIACLEKFRGMFAFALYDMRTDDLFLVRDHIGVKPLYFSLEGGYCSFASEIKALWCLPWIQKRLHMQALYHYLTFLVTPAPLTLYQGIYKLPAGHYIHINAHKKVTFVRWYNPLTLLSEHGYSDASEQDHIHHIQTLLRSSIEEQTMSDVPYGVFLSGGIDSSLITALLSERTEKVKTFTIASIDGPEYNEIEWARRVARYFNTQHYEIEIDEKKAFDFITTMVYHQDEPLADCVCIPLYYVAHLLKKSGVTVVQVGEGSDELFCGYRLYTRYLDMYERYWKRTQKGIPSTVKKAIYTAARVVLPAQSSKTQMIHSWAYGNHFFWGGVVGFSEQYKHLLMESQPFAFDPIVAQIWHGITQGYNSYSWVDYHLTTLYQQVPDADFLTSMIYLEFMQRLPELLLARVDKMTMISSVEARVPYLDHRLVEYALTIPAHYKYHDGTTKYILKQAARPFLPADIIDRPKMGFAAPTKRWFKEGTYFKAAFADMIHQTDVWSDIFDKKMIQQLFKEHQKENTDVSQQLWILYNVMSLPL